MSTIIVQLKLGIMTMDELAEWFGITRKTLNNTRKKKLEELEQFADFRVLHGKVEILEIYEEVYIKNVNKHFKMIYDVFDELWDERGLDTGSHMVNLIKQKFGTDALPISDATIYKYVRKCRDILYGSPTKQTQGKLGTCQFRWCKKVGVGAAAKYVELTEEEDNKRREIYQTYFGDSVDNESFVQNLIDEGEITEEEAWGTLKDIANLNSERFKDYLFEVNTAIGGTMVQGTMVYRYGQWLFYEAGQTIKDAKPIKIR